MIPCDEKKRGLGKKMQLRRIFTEIEEREVPMIG
jgi:hypothetical protein